jgi:hypothetical protein
VVLLVVVVIWIGLVEVEVVVVVDRFRIGFKSIWRAAERGSLLCMRAPHERDGHVPRHLCLSSLLSVI